MSRIKVFYDGACPACDKTMTKYKQLSLTTEIDWVDISKNDLALKTYDIRTADAIAKLHVINRNGCTVIGAESFVIIWEQLAYYRFFAYFCRLFRLIPIMDWIYNPNRPLSKQRCDEKNCSK